MGQDMGKPRPVHCAETIMTRRRARLQCRYGDVTVASGRGTSVTRFSLYIGPHPLLREG